MPLLPDSAIPVQRAAARVALLYLAFASLWIYFSDRLLALIVLDRQWLAWIGMAKGIAYVAITALLLYLLLRVWGRGDAGEQAIPQVPPPRKVLLAFVGLALVVPLLAYIVVESEGPRMIGQASADLSAIAELKAGQIESWLDERRGNARVLMHNAGFINEFDQCLTSRDVKARTRVLGRMQALKDVFHYDTDLIDLDGQRLLTTDAAADPANLIMRPLMAAAVRTGQAQFSELYRDARGRARLDMVVPLIQRAAGTPRLVGVAVLRTPVQDFLFPLIQTWPTASPSAESLLIRRDGEHILFLSELRHRRGEALSLRLPLNSPGLAGVMALRAGGKRIVEGLDYRGIEVLAAARPVRGTSWTLIAKVDRDEILGPVRHLVSWVSLVALAAELAVAAAVLLLWRQQQRAHQLELRAQAADKDRLLKLFYDLPFLGMAITSARNKRWLHVNDVLCGMLGYSREELLATSWDRLTHPDDLAADQALFRHFQDSKMDGCQFNKRYLRKDGSVLLASLEVRCVRGADGSPELFVATVQDITEREQAENARKISELRLAGLIESAMDAIIAVDQDQCVVLFNPAAERLFGLPADQALGRPLDRFLPERARKNHAKYIRAFAETGMTSRTMGALGTLSGLRADGQEFPIEASISQIEVPGGRLFTVILRDITERVRVEQALRESREDLNRAQAVGQIGSWRLDVQHNQLTWSDQNHRIFGIAKGTPLTYENFLAAVHPDDRDYVDRMWQAGLRGEPYDIEHRIVVYGAVKWVREKAELEFDRQGVLLGGFGTTQDITALKQAEQALRDADRRKDEFLAMLGHELRNPLVPIRNATHVLGRLGLEEPRVRWAQEIIERQVTHLSQLVDDLLEVSRIVQGRIVLKQEEIELGAVIRQVVETARPNLSAREHHFELQLPEAPVRVWGDPVRLAQVLLNLIDNAAKYTPDGGRIELEARLAGGEVEIQIRDNGTGLAPELLPRVFDLFQQGERTLDRAQGGLGIGLTLVKRLVELHGGRVEVSSPGPNQGSCFSLWLPVLAGTSLPRPAEAPAPARPAQRLRVLVVDDEPAVAESTAIFLELEGHEVRTADSGTAALKLVSEFQPQVVLLDIGLPGQDGFDVARRMRQLPGGAALKLVAVSGYGQEEVRMRAREAGFDLHLTKPVKPEALCAVLSLAAPGERPSDVAQ